MAIRSLHRVLRDPHRHWVGDGFPVRNVFGPDPAVSPFLLLDYAGPHEFEPAAAPRGVGEHPHRGFETVTLVYQGELEHRDSSGGSGSIGPGDVQWMTAASGVLHEEMHSRAFTEAGGTFEVIQLWVNLPAVHKMDPPRYQTLHAQRIPEVALEGGVTGRVIAGSLAGVDGPAATVTPIGLWELDLPPSVRCEIPVPDGQTVAVFVRSGRVTVPAAGNGAPPAEAIGAAELALYERSGDEIVLEATEAARIVVLTGEPIEEPIAARGPFVMNTPEEIAQAYADLKTGRFVRGGSRPA